MNTTDQSDYVNLSDGGHFDNLGLFEMLRRRCMTIVVVDGGADGSMSFADLGEAVRLAQLQLDTRIVLNTSHLVNRPSPARLAPVCAVGEIHYPPVKGRAPAEVGKIVYIKSSFQGIGEPADVRAFAAANPLFPHDPTTNQFFDESRFESYRALGQWLVQQIPATKASIVDFVVAAAAASLPIPVPAIRVQCNEP